MFQIMHRIPQEPPNSGRPLRRAASLGINYSDRSPLSGQKTKKQQSFSIRDNVGDAWSNMVKNCKVELTESEKPMSRTTFRIGSIKVTTVKSADQNEKSFSSTPNLEKAFLQNDMNQNTDKSKNFMIRQDNNKALLYRKTVNEAVAVDGYQIALPNIKITKLNDGSLSQHQNKRTAKTSYVRESVGRSNQPELNKASNNGTLRKKINKEMPPIVSLCPENRDFVPNSGKL